MASLLAVLQDLYIRLMVWLGAAPPPGYEFLLPPEERQALKDGTTKTDVELPTFPETTAPPVDNGTPSGEPDDSFSPDDLTGGWPEDNEPFVQTEPVETHPELDDLLADFETDSLETPQPPVPEPEQTPSNVPEPGAIVSDLPALDSVETEDSSQETLPQLEEFTSVEEESHTEESLANIAPSVTTPDITASESPVASTRPTSPVVDDETAFRYQVQRGDTLSSIAKRYGITVAELIAANDIPNPNLIYPGQKLIIPGYMSPDPLPEPEPEPEVPELPSEYVIYTVVAGDTLSGIAKRYGVTVRDIVDANQIENPNLINVGQELIIPGVVEHPSETPEEPDPTPTPDPSPEPEPDPDPESSIIIDPDFPPIGPLEAIRALYVSYFAIGHQDFRARMFELLNTTEFNAVVIDVKGDHGYISYPTQNPLAQDIGANRPTARDFDEVMAQLKAQGVYTIARMVTFKDTPFAKNFPEYAAKIPNSSEIWQDRENLSWSDPFLRPAWDYNIAIAKEAAQKGFDEVQFDYVRFPTPSHLGAPTFSQELTRQNRVAAITTFLSVARGQLAPLGVKIGADTFGYTCWRKDDTTIGQDIEQMGEYLDVLCPMLYPSTFGAGIPGYKFAIAYPYEIVHESTKRAVERVSKYGCEVRPWIQDFPDYRFDKRIYGKEEIQAQIKGSFDAAGTGFMVWDPRVKYTEGAYAPVRRGDVD